MEFTTASILLVGEYTIPAGPWGDDHFLVIIFRAGQSIEYPMGQSAAVIAALEPILGSKLDVQLCNVTTTASRVMYPPNLTNSPLYDFSLMKGEWRNIIECIRNFGVQKISRDFTSVIKEYIRMQTQTPPLHHI